MTQTATATRKEAAKVTREEVNELLLLAWALMDRLMELSPHHPEMTLPNRLCSVLVGLLRERQEAGEARS